MAGGKPPVRSSSPLVGQKHLVVFVHGLAGSRRDFDTLLKLTRESLNDDKHVHLHCVSCNEQMLGTIDGIEKGGHRVAQEVMAVATSLGATDLSIVGHSLGEPVSSKCWHYFNEVWTQAPFLLL